MRRSLWSLAGLIGMLASCQSLSTDFIVDASGKPKPGSIAQLTALDLNGARQFILIRGENRNNPVILRVHGGPGQAEMAAEVLNCERRYRAFRGARPEVRTEDPADGAFVGQRCQQYEEPGHFAEVVRQVWKRISQPS